MCLASFILEIHLHCSVDQCFAHSCLRIITPLYVYNTIGYSFICDGHLNWFQLLALVLLWLFLIRACVYMYQFSACFRAFGNLHRNGMQGYMVIMFNFLKTTKLFYTDAKPFPSTIYEGSNSSTLSQTCAIFHIILLLLLHFWYFVKYPKS